MENIEKIEKKIEYKLNKGEVVDVYYSTLNDYFGTKQYENYFVKIIEIYHKPTDIYFYQIDLGRSLRIAKNIKKGDYVELVKKEDLFKWKRENEECELEEIHKETELFGIKLGDLEEPIVNYIRVIRKNKNITLKRKRVCALENV